MMRRNSKSHVIAAALLESLIRGDRVAFCKFPNVHLLGGKITPMIVVNWKQFRTSHILEAHSIEAAPFKRCLCGMEIAHVEEWAEGSPTPKLCQTCIRLLINLLDNREWLSLNMLYSAWYEDSHLSGTTISPTIDIRGARLPTVYYRGNPQLFGDASIKNHIPIDHENAYRLVKKGLLNAHNGILYVPMFISSFSISALGRALIDSNLR